MGNNGLRTGQYTGEHHLIGAYYEGDYTTYLTSSPKVSVTPGGMGHGAGVVYEYQRNSLLLQTGLGLHIQSVTTAVGDTTYTKEHVADAWTNQMVHQYGAWAGKEDDFYYDLEYIFRDRQDFSRMTYVQVPLYMGQQFPLRSGVCYYLLGAKFSYAWRGYTEVHALGSTQGHYDRYIGTFYEMDNHGLRRDVPIDRVAQPKLKLDWDVLAHAEVGYEWGIYSPTQGWRGQRSLQPLDLRFRIAAFADASLRNINPNTHLDLCTAPDESKWDFPTYRFSHVCGSELMQGAQMRNLFAGVKVTVLFGIKGREHCILCDGVGERFYH